LKQGVCKPMHVTDQIFSIFVGTRGHLDKIPIAEVHNWEAAYLEFIHAERKELWQKLTDNRKLDDEIIAGMESAIAEFQKRFAAKT
jgi:F-type H+/Na+-transporting ATPase subunit alpha